MPKSYTKLNGKSSSGSPQYKPDPSKYLYNIDTFWFNVDAENYDLVMNNGLRDRLIRGREHLMDTNEKMTIEVDLPNYKNAVVFEIMGGQPPLYQYSIRSNDIAIYFSKQSRDDQLPMKVQINQFILWQKGLFDSYIEALNVLAFLGFAHGRGKLNRVDFAVHSDQWQWNLKDLRTFEYPRNIADDNKPNCYRIDPLTGVFESVYFGSRNTCQLRIYNKSIEAKKKKKEYFLDLYDEHKMNRDEVWNIEVEVRRDFLKQCKDLEGMQLFDDLDKVFEENRLSELWSYLMKMYYHPSPHWKVVKSGKPGIFENVTGYLTRQKDNDANAWREVAQIRGRLQTLLLNDKSMSLSDAIDNFKRMNDEYEKKKKKKWEKDVARKKLKYHNEDINETVENKTVEKEKSQLTKELDDLLEKKHHEN